MRIKSVLNLDLQIKIDGRVLLNLHDESFSERQKAAWQTDAATVDAISQLAEDCEVEVTLHFDLTQWYSDTVFYGTCFWEQILKNSTCRSVIYRGLDYYDVDPDVQILRFENGELSHTGDEVCEGEAADIPSWFAYNFELVLEADKDFTEEQAEKFKSAAEAAEQNIDANFSYDFYESEAHAVSSVVLQRESIPAFRAFLEKVIDLAEEVNAEMDVMADFVPHETRDFAVLSFTAEDGKIKTKFVRY